MKCKGTTKANKPCKGTDYCKAHPDQGEPADKTRGPEVKTKKLPDLEEKGGAGEGEKGGKNKKKELSLKAADLKKRQDVLDKAEKERGAKKKKVAQGRLFWPVGMKKPTHYIKSQKRPCPKCNRLLTDIGGQAVATKGITKSVAYLLCKNCGHQWKMPIKAIRN